MDNAGGGAGFSLPVPEANPEEDVRILRRSQGLRMSPPFPPDLGGWTCVSKQGRARSGSGGWTPQTHPWPIFETEGDGSSDHLDET